MMEPHTPISLFKMKIFMKDGTTIHGLQLQNIKSSDITVSKVQPKDHVISMRFNSLELKQFKTTIHNINATLS